jgi:hypothetical protein
MQHIYTNDKPGNNHFGDLQTHHIALHLKDETVKYGMSAI